MSAFLCGPEHIGQLVAWGDAHGPDPVAGAEALARANLGSLARRYRPRGEVVVYRVVRG